MSIPKPLLAETLDESNIDKLRFPVLASPKIDGIRARVIDKEFYSRAGKTFKNKHLHEKFSDELLSLIENFDGEFIYGSPTDYNAMQKVTSSVMAYEGPTDHLCFFVFDYVDSTMTAVERYERYMQISDLVPSMMGVVPIEKKIVSNIEELDAYEEEMLALGYEGIMVQDPNGKYKFGRASIKTQELLKVKRFADSEVVITGFYEAKHNENEAEKDAYGHTTRSSKKENMVAAGYLGGFYGTDQENGWDLKIGTGLGLTLEIRKEIWENQDKYIGKLLKYKYFKNAGMKEKPRFPVAIWFRDEDDMGE